MAKICKRCKKLMAQKGEVFSHAHNIEFFNKWGVMVYCLNSIVPRMANELFENGIINV